jgi:hypothetical protein
MLRSMGTKGGIILYHIGYGIALGCPTISGVTNCCQPRYWLIGVDLIAKPDCDQICGKVHQPILMVCLLWQVVKKLWVLLSLIGSIYHPQNNNYWIHVQLVNNMHMLMQFQ